MGTVKELKLSKEKQIKQKTSRYFWRADKIKREILARAFPQVTGLNYGVEDEI